MGTMIHRTIMTPKTIPTPIHKLDQKQPQAEKNGPAGTSTPKMKQQKQQTTAYSRGSSANPVNGMTSARGSIQSRTGRRGVGLSFVMGRRKESGMKSVRFIGFRGGIGILMGSFIRLRIGMIIFMGLMMIRFLVEIGVSLSV
jgi:hypothetical protein